MLITRKTKDRMLPPPLEGGLGRGCVAIIILALLIFSPVQANTVPESPPKLPTATEPVYKIGTKVIEPFVFRKGTELSGFSIDLWRAIAKEAGINFEFEFHDELDAMLGAVQSGENKAAIAAITINTAREERFDFSHSYYQSGLQILVASKESIPVIKQVGHILGGVFSSPVFRFMAMALLIIFVVVSHIIWLLERKHNKHFSKRYFYGVWDAFYWSIVTMSTVGYGDKYAISHFGKLFTVFWIFIGYFIMASIMASVASSITINRLEGSINGPEDLIGKNIVAIRSSSAVPVLKNMAIDVQQVTKAEAAYAALVNSTADAFVYDLPALKYYANTTGKGKVKLAGQDFHPEEYGILFQQDSELREPVNRALLKVIESGQYQQINKKWFGS